MSHLSLVPLSPHRDTPVPALTGRNFHGAAIVDEQGREMAITESMILRACRELEQHWCYPRRRGQKAG